MKREMTESERIQSVNIYGKDLSSIADCYPAVVDSDGRLHTLARNYLSEIAEGTVSGHTPWSKIGYNPALVASTEADLWSKAGVYTFPSAESTWTVSSSNNANDMGVVLKSATADSGGSATTLVDADGNFIVAGVEVGDCLILDKSGAVPEWGYITARTATVLTCSGGFSSGGSGSLRSYDVVDKNASLKTGAQVVKVEYLNDDYEEKSCIRVLSGNTPVSCNSDMFRVNSFRVITTGSGNKPVGNISLLGGESGLPTYSYITAGYTRARNVQYTVPAGKTLYVTSATFGYAYSHNSTHYARMYTRANIEPSTRFHTGSLFFPYTEVTCSNSTVEKSFEVPTKLLEKTDIKVSVLADYAGIATCALRGWLETN